MADFRFVLNSAGVVELMKSQDMIDILNAFADSIQSTAGDGYESKTVMSSDRAKALVMAESKEAINDNLENNTLLRALGGG